jgi:hypothetical protein
LFALELRRCVKVHIHAHNPLVFVLFCSTSLPTYLPYIIIIIIGSADFCNHLERLVDLAPPTSAVSETPTAHAQITGLLQTSRFQSILVTHFHHLEKEDDEKDEDETEYTLPSVSERDQDNAKEGAYADTTTNNNTTATAAAADTPQEEEEDDDEDDDEDEEEESFDPPWPTEHEAFCALPSVQEHVFLEIAAGRNSTGGTVKPMEVPKGRMRVVLPGSLRERGEFCLVDVAFMKSPTATHTNDEDYRWRVRRTRFQTINDFVL